MKKIFIVAVLMLLAVQLFAQTPRAGRARPQATPLPPPLPTREVSGIVKDATGETVIGATVTLKSKVDTVRTGTNEDGIFILKDVKLATFSVEVKGIGFAPFVKKYLNSDITKNIVLPVIVLKTSATELNTVTINGTPSIVYKTDTVEFKASDYKVRPNATVDEMLKKMEGVEVGTDGSVTFQGQSVTRAKLNGKEFSGGNVAQAIQNLPADIMEKVQFVDDYGDQAARTGVKDGDPQKILNLTTKADRSVGNMARITGQYGSNDRYNANVSLQRINANQTISIIGNFRNSIVGVASSGANAAAGGGAGGAGGGAAGRSGTTTSGSPTISYRDQWSKKVQVVSSGSYSYNNNNTTSSSFGQRYSTKGPSDFVNSGTNYTGTQTQRASFEMEFVADSANWLQVTPSFNRSNTDRNNTSLQDNINHYTTGFEHKLVDQSSDTKSNSTSLTLNAVYVHVFKKPKRNVSVSFNISRSESQGIQESLYDAKNFADSTQNKLVKDSVAHTIHNNNQVTTRLGSTITYTEPLSAKSLLRFRTDLNRSTANTRNIIDTISASGQQREDPSQNNIFNYTINDTRATLDYQYQGTKLNFSIGATAAPYGLTGTKLNRSTGEYITSSHSYFHVIPAFRFSYAWSKTEKLTINYTGRNNEPSFDEIQPFTDRTNPDNIIVGNPDLKPSFSHSVTATYNNYFANSKFTMNFTLIGSRTNDASSVNTIDIDTFIPNPADPSHPFPKTIRETHYVNIDGRQSLTGRYTISKQLDDRKYNLGLNGFVTYRYSPGMSNNILYHQTRWEMEERFGPRINPSENVEIDPYLGYDLQRSFTTLPKAIPTLYKTLSLGLTGNTYFFKTWRISYNARQTFVTGTGPNVSPLIIDGGFEKEIGAKRGLVLTFNAYDLLHKNTNTEQVVTQTGVTNTTSNALSRYYMFGVRVIMQKWSGRPQRRGRDMQRRGDGSFIYN